MNKRTGNLYRKCTKCSRVLLRFEFDPDERYADGLASWCKDCHRTAVRKRKRVRLGHKKRRQISPVDGKMFCIKCETWKAISDMSADKNRKYGVKTHCKQCENRRKNG